MYVCSCTASTDAQVRALYKEYGHKNMKAERIAKLIWRELGKGHKAQSDRCGLCIFLIVRLVKDLQENET